MDTRSVYEVIVIGAGIMGSTTAYYLSILYGDKVLLIEQFDCLHSRGSSHGESRLFRMTYRDEHYARLMPDALQYWKEIELETGTKLLTITGGLDFGSRNNPLLQSLIASAKNHGPNIEILTAAEIAKKFPTINLPAESIGLYSPDAGVLNATKCLSTLQSQAKQQGCKILDNTAIAEIKETYFKGQRLIYLKSKCGKIFIARKCVVTTGAWTQKLVSTFENIQLSLQPIQSTVAYWRVEDTEAYSSNKFPVFVSYDEPILYGTPALEFPNMIKCSAHLGTECDPDKRDFKADIKTLEVIGQYLSKIFTGIDTSPTYLSSCMTTQSSDRDFIIDQIPSCANIILGCGFSGHGFKLAPVVGKILAELVVSGKPLYPEIQKHFTLDRFKDLSEAGVRKN